MNPTVPRLAASVRTVLLASAGLGPLSGCHGKKTAMAPPSPDVTVLTVQPQTIPVQNEWDVR